MSAYEKTFDVDQDIENIVEYTARNWGHNQVRRYIAGLEEKLSDLAANRTYYKSHDHLGDGIISARYEHHFIFALKRENEPLLILANFHERMELMKRLQSRL